MTRKDFVSDQEVRWCPGCGDYAILAAMQSVMPELGIPREKVVFVSGIGCASRFPYYMDTYGVHGIHGRAPAIATGIATSRPDLSVWVVMGDGDASLDRRESPDPRAAPQRQPQAVHVQQPDLRTHEGPVLAHVRAGEGDEVDALRLPRATFQPDLGRFGGGGHIRCADDGCRPQAPTGDDPARRRAQGSAFVEIYQNCNIFNDGAFLALASKEGGTKNRIYLEHGKPIRFGTDKGKGVRMSSDGRLEDGERGRGWRRGSARARRGAERSEPGVRAVAHRRGAHSAHTVRRLQVGDATGVRGADGAAAAGWRRRSRARATSNGC